LSNEGKVITLICEMTERESREVLARATVGRLGCSFDNQPYVVPVYLAYESDYVYVFATFRQKIEWLGSNPKVCIEIDEIASDSEWASVIANGRYQELSEPRYEAESTHARELLGKRSEWWLNALAERRAKKGDRDNQIEPLFFRVQIDLMTGLRALSQDRAARAAS
jgi:uncharacterized protein